MTDVVIAPSQADARAAEAVEQHHAQMSGTLGIHVDRLVAAAGRRDGAPSDSGTQEARKRLAGWCQRELLPHARAEEQTLYPTARSIVEGRLLVEAMLGEHQVIGGLVGDLGDSTDPVRAAATATALRVVFESHLAKENDLLIPLLLRTPGVSVADLLGGMHELLGSSGHHPHADEPESAQTGGCGGGHACACGETAAAGYPELDAASIPHAIRHATIFGALESVAPGGGLVLVAPHDPLPLLGQMAERWPGRFTVDYLQQGPDTWRLALVRAGA
jgi:uncharacterized protein (DUF2249 family)/iron-sulfur cluster repair protein YtfE (RIC family)